MCVRVCACVCVCVCLCVSVCLLCLCVCAVEKHTRLWTHQKSCMMFLLQTLRKRSDCTAFNRSSSSDVPSTSIRSSTSGLANLKQ